MTMARQNLLVCSTIGFATLLLSGCVYDAGSFSGRYGDYHGRGVYAGGGLVLGRGTILGNGGRHHRWYHRNHGHGDWTRRPHRDRW